MSEFGILPPVVLTAAVARSTAWATAGTVGPVLPMATTLTTCTLAAVATSTLPSAATVRTASLFVVSENKNCRFVPRVKVLCAHTRG